MAKLTNRIVLVKLREMHGNISAVARALGVERHAISYRIDKSPELQKAVIDARESIVDNAESALNRGVEEGEGWAVCFTLKTQGKKRGYIETVYVGGDRNAPMQHEHNVTIDVTKLAALLQQAEVCPIEQKLEDIRRPLFFEGTNGNGKHEPPAS